VYTVAPVLKVSEDSKYTVNGDSVHIVEMLLLYLTSYAVDATVVSMALGVRVVDEPADEIEDNTPDVDGGGTQDSQDPDNGAPIAPLGAGLLLILALAGFWAVRRKRHP
jgi:MYXO-CTERM domain-containing protein